MDGGTAGERRALRDYDMQGPVLRRADPRAGLPAIRAAVHRESGEPVILETWHRTKGFGSGAGEAACGTDAPRPWTGMHAGL